MFILGSLESAYGLPISVNWTFFAYVLRTATEALRAKIDRKSALSLQRGQFDPKFHVEGVAPTNHSSSRKTRLSGLSYGIKIWTDLYAILSQCTRLIDRLTDVRTNRHRQTDIFLIGSSRWHFIQREKNWYKHCKLKFKCINFGG